MNSKLLSLLLSTLWLPGCRYSVPATFEDIAEAVFAYQLTSQRPPPERERIICFVSVHTKEDPSATLLERLNKKGFQVRPISQSLMKDGRIQDKASGAAGLWLSVYDVECISADNCKSKGSIQSDRDNLLGWKYQLIKENGKWKVKNTELYLES
jgi:hypothetical protein